MNTSLGDNPTGLDHIIHKYQLSDTIHHLHGLYNCATYSQGSKPIDYIFATNDILPAIKCGAILAFNAVTPSDHGAIYLNIDMNSAFHILPLPSLLKPP